MTIYKSNKNFKGYNMKKTIFLSLIAGAMIFAGCGGGGGTTTSGGAGAGNGGGAGAGNGGGAGAGNGGGAGAGNGGGAGAGNGGTSTYSAYQYGATTLNTPNLITVSNTENRWIVNPDNRQVGASTVDKTYAEAVQFCADNNQSLPSPKDLLTTTLRPNDGTSASWAAGQYVAFFTDDIIGQSSSAEATTQRKVICMQGSTIEKKHETENIAVTINESNTTNTLQGIKDITTGLSWTPIHTYDKISDPGHANQARFPLAGATGNDITAAAYCGKFGAGWRIPTLAELRTITYLDGTTGLNDPENLKPAVLWTNTDGTNAGTSYAVHLNSLGQANTAYYAEAPEDQGDKYFVTCVK